MSDTSYEVHPDGKVYSSGGSLVYTAANATLAIQWANNNLVNGGIIELPEGKFLITGMLKLNHSMVGAGVDQTQLVSASAYTSQMIYVMNPGESTPVNDLTFSDFEMNGRRDLYNSSVATTGGLAAIYANDCRFERLFIHDFPYSNGIEFWASARNLISNCKIGNIGSLESYYGYGNGVCSGSKIPGVPTEDNVVEFCEIYGCTMVAVNWEPGRRNITRDCYMHDGTYWHEKNGSLQLSNACRDSDYPGAPISEGNQFIRCKIRQDNSIFAFRSAGPVLVQGCDVGPANPAKAGTAAYVLGSTGSVFEDNIIRIKAGGTGIYFNNSKGFTARNNSIIEPSGSKTGKAIFCTGTAGSSLSGGTITGNKLYWTDYGVQLDSPMHGVTVSGNTAYNCGHPFYAVNADNVLSNNTVSVDSYFDTFLDAELSVEVIDIGGSVAIIGNLSNILGPMSGASVRFVADNGDVIAPVTTNANGDFTRNYTPSKGGDVSITAYYGTT